MKFSSRQLYYSMSPAFRLVFRRLFYLPVDIWEAITGKREELIPPRGLIYTGSGDFRESGKKVLRLFKEYCGLKPTSRVLDIGSGIGRIAIPLTGYLDEMGFYEGFDVVERGIDWCKEHITTKHSNFHFRHIPLENDLYRSNGSKAEDFKFPFHDNHFDLAIANSVFTHMLPKEVENYLKEIHRILKPGGICFATFFVFNKSTVFSPGFDFPKDLGHFRLMDQRVKSANVAYSEDYIKRELIEKNKFQTLHLFEGFWKGMTKESFKDFQDILILKK